MEERNEFIKGYLELLENIKKNPKKYRNSKELDVAPLEKMLAPENPIPKIMYSIFHYFGYDASEITNFRLRQRKFFLEEEAKKTDSSNYVVDKIVYRSKSISSILIKGLRGIFTQKRSINDNSSATILIGDKNVKQYDFVSMYKRKDIDSLEKLINDDIPLKKKIGNYRNITFDEMSNKDKDGIIDELGLTKKEREKLKPFYKSGIEAIKNESLKNRIETIVRRHNFDERFFQFFDAYYELYEEENRKAKRKAAFEFQEHYRDRIVDVSEFNFIYRGSRIDVAVQKLGDIDMIVGHNLDRNTQFIKDMISGYQKISGMEFNRTYYKDNNVIILTGNYFYVYHGVGKKDISQLNKVTKLSLHLAKSSKRANVAGTVENPLQYLLDRDRMVELFEDEEFGKLARELDLLDMSEISSKNERDEKEKLLKSILPNVENSAKEDKVLGKDYDTYPKASLSGVGKRGHSSIHYLVAGKESEFGEVHFQTSWEHFNDKYGYGSHKKYEKYKKINNLMNKIEKMYGEDVLKAIDNLFARIKTTSQTYYSLLMKKEVKSYRDLANKVYASWQIWDLNVSLKRKEGKVKGPNVEKLVEDAKGYFSSGRASAEELLNFSEFFLSQGYLYTRNKNIIGNYKTKVYSLLKSFIGIIIMNNFRESPRMNVPSFYTPILRTYLPDEVVNEIHYVRK